MIDNSNASVSSCDILNSDYATTSTVDYNLSSNKVAELASNGYADSATTITINGDSLSSNNLYWDTSSTGYTISQYDSWTSITDTYMRKEDVNYQLNILEKYFKPGLIKSNDYDRKLNKSEFLDLLKVYIKKITNRNCEVSFDKNMMLEEITFKFDGSISFSLNNDIDLQPDTYLYFNDTFHINTENILAILKKATFNRLLDV